MKKTLLATSAIIGVAAITSAAHAQPELNISGSVQVQWHFFDNEDGATNSNVAAGDNSNGQTLQTDDDIALIFSGKTTDEENGLTYGFLIDYVLNTGAIDEAYVEFEGGWGELRVGDDDTANDAMVSTGTLSPATGGFDGDLFDTAVSSGSVAPGGVGTGGLGGDFTRIVYFSPVFSGFQFGASFTPTASNLGADTPSGNNVADNQISIGAKFDADLGGATIGLSAGGKFAESESAVQNDVSEFEVGLRVGFGGFTFGTGASFTGDSNQNNTVAAGVDDVFAVDLGLQYAAGPWTIGGGATYGEARVNQVRGGVNDTGTDSNFAWSVGADYAVASGLTVFAEYGQQTSYDASDANGTVDNSAFLVGSTVSF